MSNWSRKARRAARQAGAEPDVRLRTGADVLAESRDAIVMRLDERIAGHDTLAVSVFLQPGVSLDEAAVELRQLADELERAEMGLIA